MKYLPTGYKYLLGYRPLKLQYVPISKPFVAKPVQWKAQRLNFGAKPIVSLLPPKLSPLYKPSNQYLPGRLPVNVPPTVPAKPWQQEGWTPISQDVDNKPFLPSFPLPEVVDTSVKETVPIPPPIGGYPIYPLQPNMFFQITPSQGVFPLNSIYHTKHVAPFVPTVPVQPIVPVPHHITHSVQPLPPPALAPLPTQFDFAARPLVPINYLAGKLNIPVPELGVLPLGSTVPVQVQQQHFVQKPQIVFPASPQFLHKLPQFPVPHVINKVPEVPIVPQTHVHTGFTPIEQPVQPDIHPHPHVKINVPHLELPHHHHHFQLQNFDQPQHFDQPLLQHHHQQQHQHSVQVDAQESAHEEPYEHNEFQHVEHQHHHQSMQESPGFFQPGRTDLQIPDYLPEHPHFKQHVSPLGREQNYDQYNVK